ncbi:hypothetical protein P691DRAFT_805210 [Macrolepiota fuliginosa MF-IS2]|uniref:ASX DEUBAD domain-containing protein n=1 Tax=Macrolepiota fuliginosa MF-IS2 TaxID=1400762 RepID=A0A9P5X9Z3_9AGAR|nr:hypothetical protein P691DRAFT_805210 [Macrolepiota fuliginosa MF-IS2]
MLSNESREALVALLPSTAFVDNLPGTERRGQSWPSHDAMGALDSSERTLNLNFFSDPHFLDAAHTFQDHLFSGWFTTAHSAKLKKYLDGIRDGTLAAPWKDEVWERENPRPTAPVDPVDTSVSAAVPVFGTKAKSRAGASADLKLSDLVKDGVLRAGDIIAYKRNFSILGVVVEKDTIIQSTDPLTHTLTVLLPNGTNNVLPSALTCHNPDNPGSEVVSVTISTPQMLETTILDLDGQVKKNQRPNGNAWKCFTIWRWRDGYVPNDTIDQRGSREIHGTLFYIRGCHYYER